MYIIAVNRIVKWLPICHAFFTLDPDPYVLPILNVPKNDIVYWAAVPGDYGTPNARIMYHRVTRVHDHVNFLHRLAGNGPLHSHPTLSESPDSIHTGNSLYGALGLAYHMRPERIGFWGLDATAEDYAYGAGKPRGSLLHLPELFASSMAQLANRRISVLNGSKTSRVSCFPKATPDAVLEFLSQKSQVVQ